MLRDSGEEFRLDVERGLGQDGALVLAQLDPRPSFPGAWRGDIRGDVSASVSHALAGLAPR